LQSLMSRRVGGNEQGQLQGANTSLMSIAGIVGPGVFAATFAHFLVDTPSAAWVLAAVFLLAAASVAWLAKRPRPDGDPRP
jgi:MFS transporter, DHA1 family, tetracycline resistance protein